MPRIVNDDVFDDEDPIGKELREVDNKQRRRSHLRCIGDNLCADCDGAYDLLKLKEEDDL